MSKARLMDVNAASLKFLRTELQTGVTFAHLALTAKYGDRVERNRANARLAYDTALRFLETITPESASELDAQFKHLRAQLTELGERL